MNQACVHVAVKSNVKTDGADNRRDRGNSLINTDFFKDFQLGVDENVLAPYQK